MFNFYFSNLCGNIDAHWCKSKSIGSYIHMAITNSNPWVYLNCHKTGTLLFNKFQDTNVVLSNMSSRLLFWLAKIICLFLLHYQLPLLSVSVVTVMEFYSEVHVNSHKDYWHVPHYKIPLLSVNVVTVMEFHSEVHVNNFHDYASWHFLALFARISWNIFLKFLKHTGSPYIAFVDGIWNFIKINLRALSVPP